MPGGLPPYGGDILVHVYPLLSLLARGLHAGRPTLWNFYAAGGYPLAPYGALALYPPILLALLALPVTGALAALYAVDVAVLGAGTYLLAAELGQSRPARLLAAVTLAYGGFVAAHVYAGHIFELGAICPLPLAFLLLRRAISMHSPGAALGCGAVIGLMVLAAGVQFLPFALAPLPALALWHTGARLRTRGMRPGRRAWPLAALALAGLVGVALGAVFVLPFHEVLGATLRSGTVDYATATAQSLPWGGLTMLVAPDALGNAASGSYWPASRAGPYFHEIYAYAGLLPLLLAPVGLLRCRAARPYGLLALASLLIMLGANTPLYRLVYALPGAGLLRAPARAGLPLDLALALLAGFGFDALRDPALRGRALLTALLPGLLLALATLAGLLVAARAAGGSAIPTAARPLALHGAARLAVAVLVGVTACAITARVRRPWALVLLPALAALDLFGANGALLRPTDPARYYLSTRASAVVRMLAPAGQNRVLALDGAIPLGLGMVTGHVYDVQDAAPLALADYWALSHRSLRERAGGDVATGRDVIRDVDPFFPRLFGVRILFSMVPLPDRALRPAGHVVSPRWTLPGGADWNAHRYQATSLVYRDDTTLPRLFVVSRVLWAPTDRMALAMLREGRVDPARVVVLSSVPPSTDGPLAGVRRGVQQGWAAWLGADGDNTLAVRADGGRAGGYLVVDDGWFPGWTATVDGRPAPVLRADYLLRAVRLPPGSHRVRLVYAPLTYVLGAALTLVTALMLLLMAMAWSMHHLRLCPTRAVYPKSR